MLAATIPLFILIADPVTNPEDALQVCCGASCCSIDGVCHDDGDVNPNDVCEVCDPSASQSAWSPSGDSGCGDGGGDDGNTVGDDGGDDGGGDDGGCRVAPRIDAAWSVSLLGLVFVRRRHHTAQVSH